MSPRPCRPRRRRRLDGPGSYHDVALLRTSISDRGGIRARRVTGLDADEHRRVTRAVENAREMALLPYPTTRR